MGARPVFIAGVQTTPSARHAAGRRPASRAGIGALLPATLALTAACRKVEPAPEDLDGLLHHLWAQVARGPEADPSSAVDNLHDLLDGTSEETADGLVSSLTSEEIALAGANGDADPALATGFFTSSRYPCTVELAAAILVDPRQDELYGGFDAYDRVFASDRAAFLAGTADSLAWTSTYTINIPFAGPYTAELAGEVHRIGDRRWGDLLLSRSVLVEPATFEDGEGVFDQDWRVELFYAPGGGDVRHVEGLWRRMDAGLVDTGSTTVQRAILDGLSDWDRTTARWCASGLP